LERERRGCVAGARLLLVAVLLFSGCGAAFAFEDTVQRYPTGVPTDYWHLYRESGFGPYATMSVINAPTAYPTSNALKVTISEYAYNYQAGVGCSYDMSPDYIAFTVRDFWESSGSMYLVYYDGDSGAHIVSVSMKTYFSDHHDNDLYEFIRSSTSVSLYINGVSRGVVMTSIASDTVIPYLTSGRSSWTIDDFTSSGDIIGINEVVTDSELNIDASYSIRAMHAHPTAEYKMNLIKVYPRETINSTIIGTSKPAGFVRWDRNTIFGENAGLYQITITRDGTKVGETTFYFQVGSTAGSVEWEKESYSVGEPAKITYSLVDPDFGTYTYTIKTMGLDGIADDTWAIADDSGSLDVDLSGYDTGTEYVIFMRTDKTSGTTLEFAYDYATLTETVVVVGNTTNAITGEYMPDVSVTFRQGTEWYNTTSNINSTYNLTSMSTNIDIVCNANVTYTNYTQILNETFNSSDYDTWISIDNDMITSGSVLVSNTTDETPFVESTDYNINYTDGKIMVLSTGTMSNWTCYHIDYNTTESFSIAPFSFMPLEAEVYTIDLYLFNDNLTFDNTTVYGLVGNSHYYQAINNATVMIWNATWNDTTTASSTGYYCFHNLNNSTVYNLNASAQGYEKSSDYEVNATGNATRQDIQLDQLFTITVKAKDATSSAFIQSFTAYFDSDSQTNVTTTSTATFTDVKYGIHSISVAADGYYPDATTNLIDEDTTITLTLTQQESPYYSPYYVKFKLVDVFHNVYPNVATMVYTGATASGDEYANGTTGSDGAVTFKMTPSTQYTLEFTNTTQGISKTITIYPKDTEYYIYIDSFSWTPPDDQTIRDTIDWWWTSERINTTHGWINFTYTDSANETTAIRYWINNSTELDVLPCCVPGCIHFVIRAFFITLCACIQVINS